MGGRLARRLAAALTVLTALTAGALSFQAPAGASVPSARSIAARVHEAALEAVSCPRPKQCIAVGRRGEARGQAPFAERWNGSSWTDQTIPAPPASDAYLVAISCPAPSDCTAVGGEATSVKRSGPLAEQWNGHRWRVTQAGDPRGVNAGNLYSVSCAGVNDCVAVGVSEGAKRDLTLAERWNGRSWKLLATARVRRSATFTGVDCTGRGFCMAVGEIESPAQTGEVAMAEELTKGAWKLVPTPVLAGSDLTIFYDTWCGNRSFCLAVGQSQGTTDTGIAAQWTGSSWTAQPLSGVNQTLLGISCSSSASCMAVGPRTTGSGRTRPVSQLWTGTAWSQVPTAYIPGGLLAFLYQVSCPTATRCIAVGAQTNGGLGDIGSPLAEEWNGTSWRLLRTATP